MTATPTAAPTAAPTPAGIDAWAVLQQLLSGQAAAADHLANALRVEAYGHTTFGRTDALDLFAAQPLVLSSTPQLLVSAQTIAVLDDTADGRTVGILADVVDGVINRLWVVAATAAGATAEPAVPVARDDFLSQLRQRCQGEASDHPQLDLGAWPQVVELGSAALDALQAPSAASSSQVWVMRAFSSGESVAALYRLRVQAATLPRQAHHRLALAIAQVQAAGAGAGTRAHPRLAVSDPLPEPAQVSFSQPAALMSAARHARQRRPL